MLHSHLPNTKPPQLGRSSSKKLLQKFFEYVYKKNKIIRMGKVVRCETIFIESLLINL
jgi:hypothetical protein